MQSFMIFNKEPQILEQKIHFLLFSVTMTSKVDDVSQIILHDTLILTSNNVKHVDAQSC